MARETPASLTSWHDSWTDHTVAVVGLGESGFAIADSLAELGATTHVVSVEPDTDRSTILGVLGVTLHPVTDDREAIEQVVSLGPDLVVVSPDWEPDLAVESRLWDSDLTVWSDVEFGCVVADKHGTRPDVVVIGGSSRGPLLADIAQRFLLHAGKRAARGGLEAPSILDAIRHPDGVDVLLWTLSDRQAWRMGHDTSTARRPRVSAYLVDSGHGDLETIQAVYTHTVESCIYQPGSLTERALQAADVIEGARAIGVVIDTPGMSDLGRVDEVICDRAFLDDRKDRALELCTLDELVDAGFREPHAVELAIAAMAIARALDVSPEAIGGALQAGGWPEHK